MYFQIIGAIITNIQEEKNIDIEYNFKESSDNVKEKNESIIEEVTDHIDNTVDNHES